MTLRRGSIHPFAVILLCTNALEAKTVTLTSPDNRTDVSLNLGDTLVVDLTSGDVNGFRWVSHLPKPPALTPQNKPPHPANKAKGTAKTTQFRFNAAKTGDTELVFG